MDVLWFWIHTAAVSCYAAGNPPAQEEFQQHSREAEANNSSADMKVTALSDKAGRETAMCKRQAALLYRKRRLPRRTPRLLWRTKG